MWRRLLMLAALAAGGGCVTPEDRKEWAEAMKDMHGDNMRMRSGSGADPAASADAGQAIDRPPRPGPRRADREAPPDQLPAAD